MGSALTYMANHWADLYVFLKDGRVEMDNNPVENLIRPLTLNRKNALFCGHDVQKLRLDLTGGVEKLQH